MMRTTNCIKKICNILIISIIIFINVGMFTNTSKAATYLIDEADLYSKGELVVFRYKGIGISVQFVVYKKDGIEYPAYCLNRNLEGVTEEKGYHVTVEKIVENTAVWKTIMNGYPFKTANQLGCNSNIEAFAATKMAVYDALYNYSWDDFEAINEQGKRIITSAEKISEAAKKSKMTRPVGKVEIKSLSESWEVDKYENEYVSKTYQVQTNVNSNKYMVKINQNGLDSILVRSVDNKIKSEFSANEKFKILIPISDLEKDGEFDIQVTSDLETMPILYGKTKESNIQDYALVAGKFEYDTSKLSEKYYKNKTKIRIIKQDAETNKHMQGAKFNILNEKKEIVYTDLTTNTDGIVEIENIKPGKYYIEEVKAPDGYTKYEELIEIELKLNQTYIVNVNNYEKPEEIEKQVDDNEITVIGKKEIKLPRTGF